MDLGIRMVEVPDEEFPTLGCNVLAVRPGRRHPGRGQPADRGGAGGGRLRGPHVRRDRDRDQRLGRADLHDPADPAWLTPAGSIASGSIADLTALVRIPSITGSEESVATWAAGRAGATSGWRSRRSRPDPAADPRRSRLAGRGDVADVAARRHRAGRAAGGGRRIILSGHLDVVPPGDPATWTADPWGAEIRDDALYGRGACDMKGGVAAILAAVRALGTAGDLDRLDGELVVALVPSEEDGGQGTLAAIRAGVTGDLAIITEPSNLDVVVAHAGAITFRLTVPGRAAHASQRREGVSALDNLFTLSAGAWRPTRRVATRPRRIR